jgi:NAD+ kinase
VVVGEASPHGVLRQLGLVVHPLRDIAGAVEQLERWSQAQNVSVVQLPSPGPKREVAPAGDATDCDLIVAIGGDGTMLAAIGAAAEAGRPVLGVVCGSLDALATVSVDELPSALERFREGDWTPTLLPALKVEPREGNAHLAFNDLVVVRAGAGQVAVTIHVDGVLYGSYTGDGVVASTQLGSSAYSLAAGGSLLAPVAQAYLVTPLAAHGGRLPPVVLGARSRLRVEVDPGHAGARVERDGQSIEIASLALELRLLSDQATVVRFGDEEPFLSGLRRRRILLDSPRARILEHERDALA